MKSMSPVMLLALVSTASALPAPSAAQLQMMDMGLTQFMHYSVDPWSSIEHNCVGSSPNCIPASAFNPSNLSTDQWVAAAVAFGAQEICLTAHHEGGFCLWDTKYSNYSVMQSPVSVFSLDKLKFLISCLHLTTSTARMLWSNLSRPARSTA